MTKPLTKPKKREWKGWIVLSGRGRFMAAYPSKHRLVIFDDETIAPVTISLAKPKRRK